MRILPKIYWGVHPVGLDGMAPTEPRVGVLHHFLGSWKVGGHTLDAGGIVCSLLHPVCHQPNICGTRPCETPPTMRANHDFRKQYGVTLYACKSCLNYGAGEGWLEEAAAQPARRRREGVGPVQPRQEAVRVSTDCCHCTLLICYHQPKGFLR